MFRYLADDSNVDVSFDPQMTLFLEAILLSIESIERDFQIQKELDIYAISQRYIVK